MKTVAIISEYNPFHLGHAYQIKKIREELGDDTAIMAIMSGNYTQRGEMAIMDCYLRARAAVSCGVNLVLKLPFPFSSASAEYFATAGVSIADKTGVVDVLSFGCENGSLDALTIVAHNLETEAYQKALSSIDDQSEKALGHAKRAELLYRRLFGDEHAHLLHLPNAMLGIEYLKALEKIGSDIKPHTVLRVGSGYNETEIKAGQAPSASAIRAYFRSDYGSPLYDEAAMMPRDALALYSHARALGEMPVDINRLSNVFMAFLRNIIPCKDTVSPIAGDDGGLLHHLRRVAEESRDVSELIRNAGTKKYTDARIRRVLFYALLGVTAADIAEEPAYTQVLAFDDKGRSLLRAIRKRGQIELLTKPADSDKLSPRAQAQAMLDLRADALFSLAKPVAERGGAPYRRTPYHKESF